MKQVKKASKEFGMRLELKYCERCGGLWLRPSGGAQAYCVPCAREMAKLPKSPREDEELELGGSCWDDESDCHTRHDDGRREDTGGAA